MKDLLFSVTEKDLEIQTFYSGGPGGQNQNKRMTGVRIIHKESGAIGESREERSQLQNKKLALKKLTETIKFKLWVTKISQEIISGETIEEKIDKMIKSQNIKIEIKENNKWIVVE